MNRRQRSFPLDASLRGKLTSEFTDRQDPRNNRSDSHISENDWMLPYFAGIQITDSESHPAWLTRTSGKFQGDYGGPFYSLKGFVTLSDSGQRSISRTYDYEPTTIYPNGRLRLHDTYTGIMLPLLPTECPWPDWSDPSDSELIRKGTEAIHKCSPSNPATDLSTAAGEFFRDGIPSIVGGSLSALASMSGRERRKALGHEYLNVEFGWKPLINDLRKTAKAIIDFDRILSDYNRNSGKLVRRKYDFPVEEETKVIPWRTNCSSWINPSSSVLLEPPFNQGQVLRISENTKRQWFRGAFTYYVPPANSLRNSIARKVILARKLLGISLTPDTLWNLAPWSWMVDWFSDTGDIISNWTDWAIDNQVLVYGYMMEHRVYRYTYTFQGPSGFTGDPRPPALVYTVEVKRRIKATPYGFGVDLSLLTGRQQAILAALGLTRGSK